MCDLIGNFQYIRSQMCKWGICVFELPELIEITELIELVELVELAELIELIKLAEFEFAECHLRLCLIEMIITEQWIEFIEEAEVMEVIELTELTESTGVEFWAEKMILR